MLTFFKQSRENKSKVVAEIKVEVLYEHEEEHSWLWRKQSMAYEAEETKKESNFEETHKPNWILDVYESFEAIFAQISFDRSMYSDDDWLKETLK